MKTAAVIAEYNPFHSGHGYHIEKTKKETGADYVLVVMSGHFVQRGAPALLDKYTRTRAALLGGADAVIELPALYATSSAEYFAQGAVTLLHKLGVVDFLSFGSEEGATSPFIETAAALLSCGDSIRNTIQELLKEGLSYPAAKEKAAAKHLPFIKDRPKLLTAPNNILGLEYCKALLALDSKITPFTMKRKGQDFKDSSIPSAPETFASATAIRNGAVSCFRQILPFIPRESRELFSSAMESGCFLTEDDLSLMLHHQLLTHSQSGFSMYLDCTPDLSAKICKNLPAYTGFSDFCSLLKSKDLTYARISRTLLHILLEIRQPAFYQEPYSQREYHIPYGHLLGFRKSAAPLLTAIKEKGASPLLVKAADAQTILTPVQYALFEKDVLAAHICESESLCRYGADFIHEYTRTPVILP